MVFLQLAIAATGNYAFFNLLSIALALLLLDDASLPGKKRHAPTRATESRRWPRAVLAPIAVLLLFASSVEFAATVFRLHRLPLPAVRVVQWVLPFRSVNTYGLFSIMTTTRPEIVLEGSDDRQTWRAYEFRWKPGALGRRPAFVAPHQPRLDWQMWFASLASAEENPWFLWFVQRLLEGSPPVLKLLETNPFPDRPPRYVRAVLYDYRFTDADERRADGNWWRRRETGTYLPPVTREMLRSGSQ
jgi:lipase maturation factor 1